MVRRMNTIIGASLLGAMLHSQRLSREAADRKDERMGRLDRLARNQVAMTPGPWPTDSDRFMEERFARGIGPVERKVSTHPQPNRARNRRRQENWRANHAARAAKQSAEHYKGGQQSKKFATG